MNSDWQKQLHKFSAMSNYEQVIWLSKLLFFISMLARDTYQPGTELIDEPVELRKYNELLHRISSFQMEILIKKSKRKTDKDFFLMLQDSIDELNVNLSTLELLIDKE